jgi:hypothetical protein
MSHDSYDILRRALIEALGPRPSPERRRQIAADLRSLAEQQERMATSAERQPETGGRAHASGRTPGMYIRVGREPDPQTGAMRVRLSLGKQVWFALGSPERVEVQRTGPRIWVVEAKGGGGYPVSTAGSLPSCIIAADDPLAGLAPGRYATAMLAGAAVVGEQLA